MNLKNDSYTIYIGTKNFTEKYYKDKICTPLSEPYLEPIYLFYYASINHNGLLSF